MDKDAYIKQLEKENAELKKRIEELERILRMNSMNSSKPPSSDPPGVSIVQPKHRRKKRGAKKGHQPHLRELFPPEKVTRCIELKPEVCPCGNLLGRCNILSQLTIAVLTTHESLEILRLCPGWPGTAKCGHQAGLLLY